MDVAKYLIDNCNLHGQNCHTKEGGAPCEYLYGNNDGDTSCVIGCPKAWGINDESMTPVNALSNSTVIAGALNVVKNDIIELVEEKINNIKYLDEEVPNLGGYDGPGPK